MPENNPDEQLFAILANDDPAAFHRLFDRFYAVLAYHASGIISQEQEIQDIVTRAIRSAWTKKNNFESFEKLKSYVYTITTNGCINALRNKKNQDEKHRGYSNGLNPEAMADYENRRIEQAEMLRFIYQATYELPEKCGQVCRMAFFEELQDAEIAWQLELSINTVRNHKQKGKNILREKFPGIEL